MKIKVKTQPEDFFVEEVVRLPLKKHGPYSVYSLEKRGWNTTDVLAQLSKKYRLPIRNLSYGGRKDRHALTRQYITIKDFKIKEIRDEGYDLRLCGFMDRPMGPDCIEGNRFAIVVRRLENQQVQTAVTQIELVKTFGLCNYFDDQRFGSFDKMQGFIAEKILKGHDSGALKIYLTAIHPEDKSEEKRRKKYIFEHWKDWKACREAAFTSLEREVFDFLIKHPNGFLDLLKKIPRDKMSLFLSAYQSHLWNEVLRRLVRTRVSTTIKSFAGIAGDYLFYSELLPKDLKYLSTLIIPTAAAKTRMPDEITDQIYQEVLATEGINPKMFNRMKVRQAHFESFERPAIIFPKDLSCEVANDELNPSKKRLNLKFFLGRGSYATIMIKRMVCP